MKTAIYMYQCLFSSIVGQFQRSPAELKAVVKANQKKKEVDRREEIFVPQCSFVRSFMLLLVVVISMWTSSLASVKTMCLSLFGCFLSLLAS